jgi:arylformamidase
VNERLPSATSTSGGALAFKEIYDLSLRLGSEAADYPGDPPYQRRPVLSLDSGQGCDLSTLSLSAHAGTHLDFPSHFIPGGPNQDHFPLERFLLPARVVLAKGSGPLGPAVLKGQELPPGGAVLFKTSNSLSGLASSGVYRRRYAHLTPPLAEACLAAGVSLVGVDYLSVDGPDPDGHPVHHLLLAAGVLILEGLNLAQPAPGDYTLACLPIRLGGSEAAPARAVLLR